MEQLITRTLDSIQPKAAPEKPALFIRRKMALYPQSKREFILLAGIACVLDEWVICTAPAEPQDEKKTRTLFYPKGGDSTRATLAHEYGRMIITLNNDYHFDLDRLGQHSWQAHISMKNWCCADHFKLLDMLCDLLNMREQKITLDLNGMPAYHKKEGVA